MNPISDKNPSKEAAKLYALLTSINKLLRDEQTREKYDGHLKRGFPVWKGSGYYYKKYKPGVGSVFVFVLVVISFVQYTSAWGIYYVKIAVAKAEHAEALAQVAAKKKKKSSYMEDVPEPNLDFVKPSVLDVLFFQIPLGLFRRLTGKKTVVADASPKETTEPQASSGRSTPKLSKRKLKKIAAGGDDTDSRFIE
jgi:hypothetical protein